MTPQFNILCGNALTTLPLLDAASVHSCVTSPPYFNQRDYGIDGQIGLENSIDEYIANLVSVFDQVKRVLRDDGTLWVNIGDTFYNYRPSSAKKQSFHERDSDRPDNRNKKLGGLKEKDLIGIPWKLAFALREAGWWLRQEIIWCLSGDTKLYVKSQKGVMPMSIRDMTRLNPETVQLWNGEKWTNVIGWGKSNDTSEKFKLTLRSGERINCTGGHIWPTKRGNVIASDLVIGDIIDTCLLPEPDVVSVPPFLTEDLLWLVGLYLAEGSRSEDTIQLALNSDEISWIDRIVNAVNHVGGSVTYSVDGDNLAVRIYGKVINSVIYDYITGDTAIDKHLSNKVWMMPNHALKNIIVGYLDGDGHKDKDNDRIRLGFCRNYHLEQNLRLAAARLGATLTLKPSISKIKHRRHKSFKGEWRWDKTQHHNTKDRGEIIHIEKSRAKSFWDISVKDEPHLFSLASGVLTHNCKPNPMPASVSDRCTVAHEQIFMFTKSKNYYYDKYATQEWVDYGDLGKGIKNSLSVWTIPTSSYRGAHFATYPVELPERCIKLGCPLEYCPICGKNAILHIEKERVPTRPGRTTKNVGESSIIGNKDPSRHVSIIKQMFYYRDCSCACDLAKPIILDPFSGAATTGVAAVQCNRSYIGIELNPEYAQMSWSRLNELRRST